MPAETHSHGAPLDARRVGELVAEHLAELLALDLDAITPEARLREELDADDYVLTDVIDAVAEEARDRTITGDDIDLGELETVADLCAVVALLCGAEGEPS